MIRIPTATLVLLAVCAGSATADPVIYTQPFDQTGAALASQNDIGGNGNFATVYDNFTLRANTKITDVHWTGEYFNPGPPGNITAFTIQFYADNAGTPGASLFSEVIGGTANETGIGTFGGFDAFSYDAILANAFVANAGTTYWLSVVPDMVFPPQWGWSTGTGGDGVGYQIFFGAGSQNQNDFAFDLTGTPIPEPGTLALLGLAMTGLAMTRRRKTT